MSLPQFPTVTSADGKMLSARKSFQLSIYFVCLQRLCQEWVVSPGLMISNDCFFHQEVIQNTRITVCVEGKHPLLLTVLYW